MNNYTSQSSAESVGGQARIAGLTESEHHALLAAKRRRVALDVLRSANAPIDLEDLSTIVATREPETDATDAETVERVAITLHHNHLPKMTDLGIIDYDADSNRIVSCRLSAPTA